ncbi:hypothetical protein M4D56_18775 [Cytobacillus oceanisediminis]|uniref:hypothetical protein n=1 Tax=Cytobacillus oceanisediminis TaxID=665099 RepID=UPI0020404480|nr:hypothetical protein [Cytobacillus oceanisediminis]MCM3531133.1 hypothetical protein [Cytobacillus oceanisediminis]
MRFCWQGVHHHSQQNGLNLIPKWSNPAHKLLCWEHIILKANKNQARGIFTEGSFKSRKYKGKATETITAGIDVYDKGWAEEYQQDGGKFLLFWEKTKEARFLVPVAGPNGMVQVQDGRILSGHEGFYGKILSGEARTPSRAESNNDGGHLLEALLFSLTGLITFLLIIRFLATEKAKSY